MRRVELFDQVVLLLAPASTGSGRKTSGPARSILGRRANTVVRPVRMCDALPVPPRRRPPPGHAVHGDASCRCQLGRTLRDATTRAFDNLVNAALEHSVAFVVIAGDIYDGPERGVRAQLAFPLDCVVHVPSGDRRCTHRPRITREGHHDRPSDAGCTVRGAGFVPGRTALSDGCRADRLARDIARGYRDQRREEGSVSFRVIDAEYFSQTRYASRLFRRSRHYRPRCERRPDLVGVATQRAC